MAETGPIPGTEDCDRCHEPVIWLWSPRVHHGLGGWVMFQRASEEGMTIRSHRCRVPAGEFDYTAGESAP